MLAKVKWIIQRDSAGTTSVSLRNDGSESGIGGMHSSRPRSTHKFAVTQMMQKQVELPETSETLRYLSQSAQRMLRLARLFTAVDGVSDFAWALEEAVARTQAPESQRPMMAILLGGTGVGKSTLFNALIQKPDASPVSDSQRCFTSRPYVAVSSQWEPLLSLPADLGAEIVHAELGSLALCDTPDVNGILREHYFVTEELVKQCDIVILVTSPERRADFDVTEEVRRWASRKRWLFILNRIDEVKDIEAVREDFDRRLHELGFQPDNRCRFLVSAHRPDDFDFPALRRTLFGFDYQRVARAIRFDGVLGYLQHACDPRRSASLDTLRQKLADLRKEFLERIRETYQRALAEPGVKRTFQRLVLESAWQAARERSQGFLAIPVWLRVRAAYLPVAYHLAMIGTRGFSAIRTLRAAFTMLRAALTGELPLWRIVHALGPAFQREVKLIENDLKRALEDLGLPLEEVPSGTDDTDHSAAHLKVERAPTWLFEILSDEDRNELAELLVRDIRHLGELAADKSVTILTQWVGNLLPLGVMLDVLLRVGYAWVQSAWYLSPNSAALPAANFYLLAGAIFAISLIPGYTGLSLKLGKSAKRLSQDFNPAVEDSALLEPLAQWETILDELVRLRNQTARRVESLRRTIGKDLPGAGLAWAD